MTPKPGSVAAFKQRAEAYRMTRELPGGQEYAGMMWSVGRPRDAAEEIGAHVDSIRANPVAVAMVEKAHPGLLALAEADRKQYATEAKEQIDIVKMGQWSSTMDGSYETRILVGKSDRGFHPAVEKSFQGGDSNGVAWGKPMPSQQSAEMMATRAETIWHNRYEGIAFSMKAGKEEALVARPLAMAQAKAPRQRL